MTGHVISRSHGGKYEDDYVLGSSGPDDGGRKHLWNIGKLLPDYSGQHPKTQSSSGHVYLSDFRQEQTNKNSK
jgi:hypothetical protein